MILWSKVMLALIQGLGGIYFENKNHGNSPMLYHHQYHIYPWECFLWFHIAILYILSSFKLIASQVMLCTSLTLIIHVHDINHYPSWSIVQKLIIPLKQKENKQSESSCSWILVQKKGEDDKSKSIDDGQVLLFTRAHDQSIWTAFVT